MVQRRDEAAVPALLKQPIFKDLVLIQLAVLVLVTDQFTKFLVREFLAVRESFPAEGFFRLTHIFNTGSAFGLFRDQNMPLIVVSVIGISILVLIYRSQRRPGNLLRLSLGLQFGGAAGNLLDRLRLGHVTDFVDVGRWPIFNVADASIVVGLVLLAWMFLVSDNQKKIGDGTEAALGHPAERSGIPVDPEAAPMGISGMSTATTGEAEVPGSGQSGAKHHTSLDAAPDASSETGTTAAVPCTGDGQQSVSLPPQAPEEG